MDNFNFYADKDLNYQTSFSKTGEAIVFTMCSDHSPFKNENQPKKENSFIHNYEFSRESSIILDWKRSQLRSRSNS